MSEEIIIALVMTLTVIVMVTLFVFGIPFYLHAIAAWDLYLVKIFGV